MGQAKQRGTLEQRINQSLEKQKEIKLREAKERMARAAFMQRRGKSQTNLLIALSMAMGSMDIKNMEIIDHDQH